MQLSLRNLSVFSEIRLALSPLSAQTTMSSSGGKRVLNLESRDNLLYSSRAAALDLDRSAAKCSSRGHG